MFKNNFNNSSYFPEIFPFNRLIRFFYNSINRSQQSPPTPSLKKSTTKAVRPTTIRHQEKVQREMIYADI